MMIIRLSSLTSFQPLFTNPTLNIFASSKIYRQMIQVDQKLWQYPEYRETALLNVGTTKMANYLTKKDTSVQALV